MQRRTWANNHYAVVSNINRAEQLVDQSVSDVEEEELAELECKDLVVSLEECPSIDGGGDEDEEEGLYTSRSRSRSNDIVKIQILPMREKSTMMRVGIQQNLSFCLFVCCC